jgi:hypothetical protein
MFSNELSVPSHFPLIEETSRSMEKVQRNILCSIELDRERSSVSFSKSVETENFQQQENFDVKSSYISQEIKKIVDCGAVKELNYPLLISFSIHAVSKKIGKF